MLHDDPLKGKAAADGFHTGAQMTHFLSWCHGSSKPYAVMLFNLCNLKRVNDALGETVGDQLLKEFMTQIKDWFTGYPNAKLFKHYRDKVHVVIYDLNREELAGKLVAIRNDLRERVDLGSGPRVPTYVSYGYALSTRTPFSNLMDVADLTCDNRKLWWYGIRGIDYAAHKNPLATQHSSRALSITEQQDERELELLISQKTLSQMTKLCDTLYKSQYKDKELKDSIRELIRKLEGLIEDSAA